MAYFLRSGQGQAEYVSIPNITTATNVWALSVDVKLSLVNGARDSWLLGNDAGTTSRLIYVDGTVGDHILRLRTGTNRDFDITGVDLTQRTKIEIVSDGTDLLLYLNEALHQTLAGAAHIISLPFNTILQGPNSPTTNLDLYEAYFSDGFTQERRYDPSASAGTGSVLTDTISAQNGTLIGFPVDDTQWILYEAGPSLLVTAPLTPGGTISGTYFNFDTIPTTLEGIRGANSISSAGATPAITSLVINDNGDGTGDFAAEIASLNTTGVMQFLRFSDPSAGIVDPSWRLS